MIKISVIKDKEGFIWQMAVQGHAGFDENGSDIVCSAVSITFLNAAHAIEKLVGISTDLTVEAIRENDVLYDNHSEDFENEGMKLSIPTDISTQKHDIFIIMRTAFIGFESIALKYSDYVSVIEEEV